MEFFPKRIKTPGRSIATLGLLDMEYIFIEQSHVAYVWWFGASDMY